MLFSHKIGDMKVVEGVFNMLDELIGYQILSMDESGFVVQKDEKKRHFKFDEDYGGCCGWTELSANLFIEEGNKNNPIITCIKYSEEEDYSQKVIITFFVGEKKLAEIEAEAGSGSGWHYGACVTCCCIETKEEEILASW